MTSWVDGRYQSSTKGLMGSNMGCFLVSRYVAASVEGDIWIYISANSL
jgi:hypothetical protein